MVKPRDFYNALHHHHIRFFVGVPDSLLKNFCAYVEDTALDRTHITAANEGNAVAIAAGHYLAKKELSLVYMQNSGLGNAINPLTSLTPREVYRIPMLLLIGWRGEPGMVDEPQHMTKGQLTLPLLEELGIHYSLLPGDVVAAERVLQEAVDYMGREEVPYALVVRKNTFAPYTRKERESPPYPCSRREAIQLVLSRLKPLDVVVCTTGAASRELYAIRQEQGSTHEQDFLTIGSMGHASQIALGMALSRPERNVLCLDGDGAMLMHMGGLSVIGQTGPSNFKHILLNNGVHDSVGGQPTAAGRMDMPSLFRACAYQGVSQAITREEILEKTRSLLFCPGPSLLEIKVKTGTEKDLGRPTTTPLENRCALMAFLQGGDLK